MAQISLAARPVLESPQLRLRPITSEDAADVQGLRTDPDYNRYLSPVTGTVADLVALTVLCYVISALFSYVAQRFFTFGNKIPRRGSWLRYIGQHALCMALNSGGIVALVEGAGLALLLAQLLTTVVVAVTSFALSYLWVYR